VSLHWDLSTWLRYPCHEVITSHLAISVSFFFWMLSLFDVRSKAELPYWAMVPDLLYSHMALGLFPFDPRGWLIFPARFQYLIGTCCQSRVIQNSYAGLPLMVLTFAKSSNRAALRKKKPCRQRNHICGSTPGSLRNERGIWSWLTGSLIPSLGKGTPREH